MAIDRRTVQLFTFTFTLASLRDLSSGMTRLSRRGRIRPDRAKAPQHRVVRERRPDLTEARKENPNLAEALLNLDHALMDMGQEVEARSCWRRAVVAKP